MPITKGSQAAHERALKAAATRKRNKAARGASPAFPKSYHATPTRHVTRDLRLKYPKTTLRKPLTKAQVKRATNDQLRDEVAYWGNIRGSLIKTRAQDNAYYAAKDELNARANPRIGTFVAEYGRGRKAKAHKVERLEAHRMRRGVKKQRGGK